MWGFWWAGFIKLAEHIFRKSSYNSLAIRLAGFSAKPRIRKLRLKNILYKNTEYLLKVQSAQIGSILLELKREDLNHRKIDIYN